MDANAVAQQEELIAKHAVTPVSGVSGAAIAYDYRPCQSIAVREVAIGGRRDCRCLARRDHFVFAGVHGGGVAVLDVTDPRTSPIVGALAMPGTEIVDLLLDGDTLYAADFTTGIHAIDVSDPKQPRHLASHPALTHTQNRRVAKHGDVLVLLNDHSFSVFDVAKPGLFRPLALHFRLRAAVGWLRSAELDGTRLHVTQGPVGLWTFDLSDPARPRVIAGQEPRLDSRPNERLIADTMARLGDRLFVGTSSGVWVSRLGDGAPASECFFTGPGTIREPARGALREGQLYFCAFEPHDHVFHVFDAPGVAASPAGEAARAGGPTSGGAPGVQTGAAVDAPGSARGRAASVPGIGASGVRYLGRQRMSRMIERVYDLVHGDGYWIAAAGNNGVLFASY